MNPVTGPFVTSEDTYSPTVMTTRTASSYKQAKPFNLPLAYDAQRVSATAIDYLGNLSPGNTGGVEATGYTGGPWDGSTLPTAARQLENLAYARAYDSFMRKSKNSASVAVSLAEGKQSWSMIADRAGQLLGLARDLKKGNLSSFRKRLGFRSTSSAQHRKHDVKGAAGTWLEYTFGWAPLIGDIGSAIDVLQQDFNPFPIRGRGMAEASVSLRPNSNERVSGHMTFKSEVRGTIKVTNPNLFLANQLGFINPATIAWELVPFSFVVDWFLPVGRFISSWTDSIGMEIIQPSATKTRFASLSHSYSYSAPNDIYSWTHTGTGRRIIRRLGGFTLPSLRSRSRIPTADAWLAATSVSLLVQQLRSFR